MEVAAQAESLIQKWEDELGPLKNLRADLYGPGGRLEGVRKITDGRKGSLYEKDDVRLGLVLCMRRLYFEGVEICLVCQRDGSLSLTRIRLAWL